MSCAHARESERARERGSCLCVCGREERERVGRGGSLCSLAAISSLNVSLEVTGVDNCASKMAKSESTVHPCVSVTSGRFNAMIGFVVQGFGLFVCLFF